MEKIRKVCVVTGTRAEYGLLKNLAKAIQDHPKLELILAVTGTHLSPHHGLTVQEICEDGFDVSFSIENQLSSDSFVGMAKSTALALSGFAEAFDRNSPDIVVILGDRYEALGAGLAANICKIPIAHIHGGETTVGALDDAFRHCLTKLAQLHFVCTDVYRKRVLQLGEDPECVFNVGALAVDSINNLVISRAELERDLVIDLSSKPYLLITYHAVTLSESGDNELKELRAMLEALNTLDGYTLIFTQANADSGSAAVTQLIKKYVAAHSDKAHFFASLGHRRYLGLMKEACAVVGNSSSGIFEASCLGTPSVDIGDRQQGRLKPSSVLHCPGDQNEILKAIEYAASAEFQKQHRSSGRILFGKGGAGIKMANILADVEIETLNRKVFRDIS